MRRPTAIVRAWVWATFVAFMCFTCVAQAQAPATSSSAPRVVGERIPTSGGEALQKARATQAELERIEAKLPSEAKIKLEVTALDALDHGLEERASRTRDLIDATSRSGQLEDVSYRWQHERTSAAAILGSLQTQAEGVAEQRKRIEEIHALWSEIDAALKNREVSVEVRQRIAALLKDAARVRAAARDVESRVLEAQVRATEDIETIDGVLAAVLASKPSLSNALERGDPIWRLPLRRSDAAAPIETLWSDLALARELARDVGGTLLFLAIGFLLIAIAFSRLKDPEADDASFAPLRTAPIASSALLTVILMDVVLVAIPSGVQLLLDVIATLACLRLLKFFFPPAARFAARWALMLIVVDVVRHWSFAWPLPDRIGVAAVMGLVAFLAFRGHQQHKQETDEPTEWVRWASFGLLGLAVGALVTSVLGYEGATELAAAGALRGARLACHAYVTYRVALMAFDALLHTRQARRLAIVRDHHDLVLRRVRFVLMSATIVAWAWAELDLLAAREVATSSWQALMDHRFEVGSLRFGPSQLLLLIVGIALAIGAAKLTRFVLANEVLPRLPMSPGGQHAASTTASYSALVIAFLAVLASVGFELGQLAFLAGALGVGIGFGLQNIVNNFVSGLVLLFGRPVEMGDIIVVADMTGEVRRIGFRSSTLRTLDGAEVIVPNSEMISSRVTNWTLSDPERRVDVPIGVAYGSPVERVRDVLLEAALVPERVLKVPAPEVLFSGFGDSSLDFVVRVWFRFEDHIAGRSELCFAISAALQRAEIQIPFPQRDLHLKSIDAAASDKLRS